MGTGAWKESKFEQAINYKRSRGEKSMLNELGKIGTKMWLRENAKKELPTQTVQIFKITINKEDYIMMKDSKCDAYEFKRVPQDVMKRDFKHEKTHNSIDNIFERKVDDLDFLKQMQLKMENLKSVKSTNKRLR